MFTLGNVYLPHDNHSVDSINNYQCALGEMQSVLDDLSNSKVLLIGDFNADPYRGRFWRFLKETVDNNLLVFRDLCLGSGNFTFLSAAHNTTSWLDHVVSSVNLDVCEVKIL